MRISNKVDDPIAVSLTAASSAPAVDSAALTVADGLLLVRSVAEGYKATYSAAVNAHAPAATPTDWFTILGSATKTIRVTRLVIWGRATAGNQYLVSIRKYGAAFTGGTAAAVTIVPHDSGNAAATAVANTWAAGLPTVGATLVGAISNESLPLAVLGTPAGAYTRTVYDFTTNSEQGIVLRGVAQYLALNSNAVALPAGTVFDVRATWTED